MISQVNNNFYNAAIILSANYMLKGSASEPFLLNVNTGDSYQLNHTQYQFFRLCNGKHTLKQILSKPDGDQKAKLQNLISDLHRENIILFQKPYEKFIDFGDRVSHPHLRNIHWETTSLCNLRCNHCLQDKYLKTKEKDLFNADLDLIDQMGHLNVMHVSLSGGEPLMKRKFFETCHFIESKMINIKRIFTNGILLNREAISELNRLKSKIEVVVSFDGFKASEMSIRGIDEETIKQVFKAIKHAISEGINIAINTSVNKFNVPNLKQTYKILKSIGVRRWRLGVPMRLGAYSRNYGFFEPGLKSLQNSYFDLINLFLLDVIKARKTDSEYMDVQIDGIFSLNAIECIDGKSLRKIVFMCDYDDKLNSICIKPNGLVTPCSEQIDNTVGDLRKSSLKEIWYSEKCQKAKQLNLCDLLECMNCKMLIWCGGGCRANYDTTGNGKLERDKRSCGNMAFLFDRILPLMKSLDTEFKDRIEQRHAL